MTEHSRRYADMPPPLPEQRTWVYLLTVLLGFVAAQWLFPPQIPDTLFMHVGFGLLVGGPSGGLVGWAINGIMNRLEGKVRPPRPW
jgi:hypothetical protein